MDTSEQYIKMSDCPEMQDRRPIFPLAASEKFIGISCSPTGDFAYHNKGKFTFLRRQDQLLGMLDNHKEPLIIEMINVHQWHIKTFSADTGERLIRDVYNRKSCEIALLEIVMILLHNKKWNGEKWNA